MQLLDATQVKATETKAEAERVERTASINAGETASVKRLNLARESEVVEVAAIQERLEKKRQDTSEKEADLDRKIASRRNDLRELLKPIDDQRREAEDLLKEATGKSTQLDELDRQLNEKFDRLVDRAEGLSEREDAVREKEEETKRGWSLLAGAQQRHRESSEKLAADWLSFHRATHEANDGLLKREQSVQQVLVATKMVQREQEAESQRLADLDRAVRDKYVALDQAKRHLNIP